MAALPRAAMGAFVLWGWVVRPNAADERVCAPASRGKYVLFERDHGALTNALHGALYACEIACATGRTLVLPPSGAIWMKDWGPNSVLDDGTARIELPRTASRLEDFWDFAPLAALGMRVLPFAAFVRENGGRSLQLPWGRAPAGGLKNESAVLVATECASMRAQAERLRALYARRPSAARAAAAPPTAASPVRPAFWQARAEQLCAAPSGASAGVPDFGELGRRAFWTPPVPDCPLGERPPKPRRQRRTHADARRERHGARGSSLMHIGPISAAVFGRGAAGGGAAGAAERAPPRAYLSAYNAPTTPSPPGSPLLARARAARVLYWPMDAAYAPRGASAQPAPGQPALAPRRGRELDSGARKQRQRQRRRRLRDGTERARAANGDSGLFPRLFDCYKQPRANARLARARDAILQALRPSGAVAAGAAAAVRALGGARAYVALHYRAREFDWARADDSAERVAAAVRRALRCAPGRARGRLYVATDAPRPWFTLGARNRSAGASTRARQTRRALAAAEAWPGGGVGASFWAEVAHAAESAARGWAAEHALPTAARGGVRPDAAARENGGSALTPAGWAKLVSLVEGEVVAKAALVVGTRRSSFSAHYARAAGAP